MTHWERTAREVIERVRKENPTVRGQELKALLSKVYPFGERKYHPYKVWLKLVNEVCGTTKPKASELEKLDRWNRLAKGEKV